MLSTKLKNRELHDKPESKDMHDARVLLDNAAESLVRAMVGVEYDELYTREEIERFVLKRLEYHETHLYGMSKDEFDEYLDDKLLTAIIEKARLEVW